MKRFVALLIVFVFAFLAQAALAGVDPVKASEVQAVTPFLVDLPEKDVGLTLANSQARIEHWEFSILPWFAREGISNVVNAPQEIVWYWAGVGPAAEVTDYTFGIDAFTDCRPNGLYEGPLGPFAMTGPVWINSHYINPTDENYQDIGYIFTLIHELAHDQGICNGPSDYVESSTQLAALEVASAMGNAGNVLAASSVLHEWRDIVLGAMIYDALRTDDLDSYYAFLKTVVSPAEFASRMSRYRARFTDPISKYEWSQVYRKYSFAVYVKAEWCLHGGTLAASDARGHFFAAHALVPSHRPLVMDDFGAFVRAHGYGS